MKRFEILERKPDRWLILDHFYAKVEVVRFTSHGYARLFVTLRLWETDRAAVLDYADDQMRGWLARNCPAPEFCSHE